MFDHDYEAIPATELQDGDDLVNHGTVTAVERVGVFVIASVRANIYSLATGKSHYVEQDRTFHAIDEVVVDRTE